MKVLDVNDNAPEFARFYEAFVCENAKAGQVRNARNARGCQGKKAVRKPIRQDEHGKQGLPNQTLRLSSREQLPVLLSTGKRIALICASYRVPFSLQQ